MSRRDEVGRAGRVRAISAVAASLIAISSPCVTPAANAAQARPKVTVQDISAAQPPGLAAPCHAGASSTESDLVERAPQIAINPLDRNIVAVWEQGNRNETSDPSGILGDETVITAARSGDGGETWTEGIVPDLSCRSGAPGGAYNGPVAEPNLRFGPDGTLYITTTSDAPPLEPKTTTPAAGEQLSVSRDNGTTWTGPVPVDVGDRGVLAADPTAPGTAYIAYDHPIGEPGNSVLVRRVTTTADGAIRLSEPAVALPAGPGGQQALGQDIGVLADGTIVVAVLEATPFVAGHVVAVSSRDHGTTWSLPVEIATCDPDFPSDPDTGAQAVAGANTLSVAAYGNRAYIAWTSLAPDYLNGTAPLPNFGEVMVAASDGGVTWDPADVVIVNPDSDDHQVMQVRVAAGPQGVGVVYYDFRNDQPALADNALTTDVWFASSLDGTSNWRESHVAGPFDLRHVGPAAISNYIDLTATPAGFEAIFPLGSPMTTKTSRPEGAVDIYRARIS
jgi:hypothetical protein